MAKNKPANKYSARDLLLKMQKEDISETTGMEKTREKDIEVSDYNDELNNQIIKYNSEIFNLDPEYTSLRPLKKLIVRVFLKEMKRTNGGLLIPNVVMVKKPTQSGIDYVGEVEAPPYSKKAIVVAVPKHFEEYMKPGTVIILEDEVIEASVLGRSQEATVRIKNAFVHPEKNLSQFPENPSSADYGYLAIPYEAISFIIQNG